MSDQSAGAARASAGAGTDAGDLRAELWRGDAAGDPDLRATVYVVTGRHGWLRVPESFCRECHLFARAADEAAARVDADVEVRVVSWWTRFPWALLRGGYHPPVLVVGDRLIAQGHDVPTPEAVAAAMEAELAR